MISRKRGFTLIELLMVLAIISLLSGVVYSSLNQAREKARVAAAVQYSESLKHVYGDKLISEWVFNDGSNNAIDTSGNGLTGSFHSPQTPKYVPGVIGNAVNLTGSGTGGSADYIRIDQNAKSNLIMENTSGGAIEFWYMQTGTHGGWSGIMTWRNYRPSFLTGYIGGNLQFIVRWTGAVGMCGAGNQSCAVIPVTLDKWHHVMFTWTSDYKSSGNGYYELYYDGNLKEARNFTPGAQENVDSDIGIAGGSQNFVGYIDGVRVYNEPLFDNS